MVFKNTIEGYGDEHFAFRWSTVMQQKVRAASKKTGLTMSAIIRAAVQEWLERYEAMHSE